MPFKVCTFCYHPNITGDSSFGELSDFLKANSGNFIDPAVIVFKKRKKNVTDDIIKWLYFLRRR